VHRSRYGRTRVRPLRTEQPAELIDVRLPLISVGLRKSNVRKDAMDEVPRHLGGALRVIVERRDRREDGGSCVGRELHVAQVDAVERRLAHAEDERATLLEADVGGAMDEVGGEAVGDGCERSHGAGKNHHRVGGIATACDVRAYVGVGMLAKFFAGGAE